jgi:hypothetical protein
VPDSVLLIGAFTCAVIGFAWLAVAMDVHWRQVRGTHAPARTTQLTLRVLGSTGLACSLALCLSADHPSIAALVWVMSLAAAAQLIAYTLAWRPRWLAPLIAWSRT